MIDAVVNVPFTAVLIGYDAGVAAELTVEVYDPVTGASILAPSGVGITEPRPGTYSVQLQVASAGDFELRWGRPTSTTLAVGEDQLHVATVATLPAPSSLVPTLEQVGTINRARTIPVGMDSTPLGTFTDSTRPTGDEVLVLTQLAANQVEDQLGNAIPDEFLGRAADIAALYAAALVESATDDPRDKQIDQWTKLADDHSTMLGARIKEVGAGGEEGPTDDQLLPVYSFPAICPLPEQF